MTATTALYRASPTKRVRRTRADIDAIRRAIVAALREDRPMTVRQVFYRLVSRGAIDKTEGEYKATVCRLLAEMRRDGAIPFGWIADNTRWMRKPRTYASLHDALRETAAGYRRRLWDTQAAYVEVWLEKDALAGVLYEETDPWDVPLMVTRGYPSLTYLYEAAAAIAAIGKPAHLYYFGDYDPSGVDIPRKVERDLRAFAPGAEIHFERVAVTPAQIAAWGLPTRPTKATDSRAHAFDGDSVEGDAIEPARLRELAAGCIGRHVARPALDRLLAVEREERQTLATFAAAWSEGGGGIMIDHVETPPPAEARRRLRELRAECLPILAYVIAEVQGPGRLLTPPILHVGTKTRPDVADLLRVHRQERPGYEGDAWSQLFAVMGQPLGAPWVFLDIRTLQPARCTFTLGFRLDRHRGILGALATSGLVGIAAEAPRVRDGLITTPSLLLEVSGTGFLRELLRAADRTGVA